MPPGGHVPVYRNFTLQPGYVESTRLCVIEVCHLGGFATIGEALADLKARLRAFLEHGVRLPKCCAGYLESNPEFTYCPKCGQGLHREDVEDEHVADLFWRIPERTLDGSFDFLEFMEEGGWVIGRFDDESEAPCFVQGVTRYMRDDDGFCEGAYPDGTSWRNRE
jgi:hypothetical protein